MGTKTKQNQLMSNSASKQSKMTCLSKVLLEQDIPLPEESEEEEIQLPEESEEEEIQLREYRETIEPSIRAPWNEELESSKIIEYAAESEKRQT